MMYYLPGSLLLVSLIVTDVLLECCNSTLVLIILTYMMRVAGEAVSPLVTVSQI